jgi:pentatricopeptide repeat protein
MMWRIIYASNFYCLVLDGLWMDGKASEAFRLLYELIENGSMFVAAPHSFVMLHHALEQAGKKWKNLILLINKWGVPYQN